MRKKIESKFDKYTLIICALFISAVIIVAYFSGSFKEKFDPKKHVCEETCGDIWTMDNMQPERAEDEGCLEKRNELGSRYLIGDKCISWRKKNYCELHPEDEQKCVCSEYDTTDYELYKRCKDAFDRFMDSCLASGSDCFSDGCDVRSPICVSAREKTLEDLSCAELEDLLINGNSCIEHEYEPANTLWIVHNPCIRWKYPFNPKWSKISPESTVLYLMNKQHCFTPGKI